MAVSSSIPNDSGRVPLFLINLSSQIESKILLTELVEILFLLAIFFSLPFSIKSKITDNLVLLEICLWKSTNVVVAEKVLLQCLQWNLCLSNKRIVLQLDTLGILTRQFLLKAHLIMSSVPLFTHPQWTQYSGL